MNIESPESSVDGEGQACKIGRIQTQKGGSFKGLLKFCFTIHPVQVYLMSGFLSNLCNINSNSYIMWLPDFINPTEFCKQVSITLLQNINCK